MRKIVLIVLVLIVIFAFMWTDGLGIFTQKNVARTPENAIYISHKEISPAFEVVDILEITDIDKNTKILFYENLYSGILVSMVQRTWNGRWEHISTSGELVRDADEPYSVMYSFVGMKVPLIWGIIHDKDIISMQIQNQDITITEDAFFRLFYLVLEDPLSNQSVQIKAYTKEGATEDIIF